MSTCGRLACRLRWSHTASEAAVRTADKTPGAGYRRQANDLYIRGAREVRRPLPTARRRPAPGALCLSSASAGCETHAWRPRAGDVSRGCSPRPVCVLAVLGVVIRRLRGRRRRPVTTTPTVVTRAAPAARPNRNPLRTNYSALASNASPAPVIGRPVVRIGRQTSDQCQS